MLGLAEYTTFVVLALVFLALWGLWHFLRWLHYELQDYVDDIDNHTALRLIAWIPLLFLKLGKFIIAILAGWAIYESAKDARDWWNKP